MVYSVIGEITFVSENNENAKILILDDDELYTKSLMLTLKMQTDYVVEAFNSAKLALEYLKKYNADVIISDFVMPEMNGIDFLTEAKKLQPSVTTILLTGYADKENAIKAINEVGIYKYLEKTCQPDDLLLNVKNAVERSQLIETVKMQKEIERLRNDFVATLTHDLRTPLLASIQSLEFFLDGTFGNINEKQREFLSAMLNSNEDMLGLVNALLEVYKYEAGSHELFKDNFDLSSLIKQCLQEIASISEKKNIKIELDIQNDLVIFADKREIRRVIANFLGNALAHTKDKITLTAQNTNNSIIFSVKDNGEGISDEDKKKLFKRFSQGTSKKRSVGTGLGLYLSRQIIEAHGGKIGVKSQIGKGSEFYFELGDIKCKK